MLMTNRRLQLLEEVRGRAPMGGRTGGGEGSESKYVRFNPTFSSIAQRDGRKKRPKQPAGLPLQWRHGV